MPWCSLVMNNCWSRAKDEDRQWNIDRDGRVWLERHWVKSTRLGRISTTRRCHHFQLQVMCFKMLSHHEFLHVLPIQKKTESLLLHLSTSRFLSVPQTIHVLILKAFFVYHDKLLVCCLSAFGRLHVRTAAMHTIIILIVSQYEATDKNPTLTTLRIVSLQASAWHLARYGRWNHGKPAICSLFYTTYHG